MADDMTTVPTRQASPEEVREWKAEGRRTAALETKRDNLVQRLNRHPVNQAARRWLLRQPGKTAPAVWMQHSIQLMLWGLEEEGLGWRDRDHTEMMREFLHASVDRQDQARFLRLLLGDPEEPQVTELDLKPSPNVDKATAAWRLLDVLDSTLTSLPENNGIYPPEYPLRLPGD